MSWQGPPDDPSDGMPPDPFTEQEERDFPGPVPPRRDKRIYFALMGTCLTLIILAWVVIVHVSVLASVIMSAVALVIPPFAAIIANRASAVDTRRPPPGQRR